MSNFLRKKAKILFVCFFVLLTCTACSSPRGKDGKTKVDQIISNEEFKVKRSDVSIENMKDAKLEKEYKMKSQLNQQHSNKLGLLVGLMA